VAALNGLAYCRQHFKQREEAFKLLQKAKEIDPDDCETTFNLARHHLD